MSTAQPSISRSVREIVEPSRALVERRRAERRL